MTTKITTGKTTSGAADKPLPVVTINSTSLCPTTKPILKSTCPCTPQSLSTNSAPPLHGPSAVSTTPSSTESTSSSPNPPPAASAPSVSQVPAATLLLLMLLLHSTTHYSTSPNLPTPGICTQTPIPELPVPTSLPSFTLKPIPGPSTHPCSEASLKLTTRQ